VSGSNNTQPHPTGLNADVENLQDAEILPGLIYWI